MATPITNIPQGFLSLLGLRDMGGVPREVVSTITPGIDVTQFLLLNREYFESTGTFNAVGGVGITNFEVPAGELWYVHGAAVRTAALTAGQTARIGIENRNGGVGVAVGDPGSATASQVAVTFTRDLWVPSGGSISFRVQDVTAGPISFIATIAITRLRI
jgi:hypothetical protein